MRWYVNDLSVQGQFPSSKAFNDALKDLLSLRQKSLLRNGIYCTRDVLRWRPIGGDHTVADAIRLADRDFRIVALQWLDKFGPFVEEDRQREDEDYFEYEGIDVTNQGLGEAARRIRHQQLAGSFSFIGGEMDFAHDELPVDHGLPEDRLGRIVIPNAWTTEAMYSGTLQRMATPASWTDLLKYTRVRFEQLLIPDEAVETLLHQEFRNGACKSIIDLLVVLDEFMTNRRPDGRVTKRGREILDQYFVGENAWYSDESRKNKVDFVTKMTFPDPENRNNGITCFWHGKIQTPQLRIHFEWPVPVGQRILKVLYIGPKISKR
ncbi:MAG: hypothetical protein R3D05_07935 [Dongiaceae bacterium]